MSYHNASVVILGTGAYAPEKIVTNDDMSKIVNTNDEWIRTRTGIRERHFAAEHEATSDLAAAAAEAALEAAGSGMAGLRGGRSDRPGSGRRRPRRKARRWPR